MIQVVAVITTKPGQRERVLEAARDTLPDVRAEKGCIEYGPVVAAAGFDFQTELGPDTCAVVEKWQVAVAL